MVAFRRFALAALLVALTAGVASAQLKTELTKDNLFIVSTPLWKLVFNGERGGELNQALLFDGDKFYRVNSTFAFKSLDTIPSLSFANSRDSYYSGKWDVFYANEGRNCKFEIIKEAPGEVHFRVQNKPRVMENGQVGPWVVTYTWHVYDLGVVFCDFDIELPTKDDTFELAWSLMGMHVEDYMFKEKHQGKVSKFLWNWGMTGKMVDGGRWQPPVLSAPEAQPLDIDFSANTNPVMTGRYVSYGSATFNLDHLPDTSFTNAMEAVFENAKPLGSNDLKDFGSHFKFRQSGLSPPPTWMGSDRNPPTFSFEWNLYHGENIELAGPYKYSNRFGLAFTVQRTTGSPNAHPVMRNNLQGARIYHWLNAGKTGAAWYPSTDDVSKMAANGADVLVLGAGWKSANAYKAADAGELKRVVDSCHEKGLRVGLTMNGQDYPMLEKDTSWFTGLLKRDSDGLYVINPSFLEAPQNANAYPVKISGEEVTALGSGDNHVDAYANFLWSRKLRNLVGPGGFLIADTGQDPPTRIATACFDAIAPDIGRLSGTLDPSVYARFRTGNGCVPRAAMGRFARGNRPLAFAAAFGDSPQVLLGEKAGEPTDPSDEQNMAFAKLWKIYASADVRRASSHNTVNQADKVYALDTGNLQGTLYRISDDEMLLVFANVGPTTAGNVTLDFKKLNMKPGTFAASVMRISSRNELTQGDPITVTGGKFNTGEMSRFDIASFHLKRQ